MENSENTPSEKELLPESLRQIVENFSVDLHGHISKTSMLYNLYKLEDIVTQFWHTMHKEFEALPDPAHEIPASNCPTETTPREDLIDVAVLSILENVEDLWPSDKDTLKKELRDELMDLLERVVERMT